MTSATEKSIKELYPLVMDEFDRDPAKAPQTASAIPKPAAVPQPTNPVTITKEKASIARHEPQVNSEPDALTEYLSSLTQERQREIKKYSNLPESDLEIPTEKRAAAILATFCKKYATVPAGQRNHTLFKLSCTLRRCGYEEKDILAGLWQFSREHCKPPHKQSDRSDVEELTQLSRRAARHVRPGFPVEKVKGEHTPVNVPGPAPAAMKDIDIGKKAAALIKKADVINQQAPAPELSPETITTARKIYESGGFLKYCNDTFGKVWFGDTHILMGILLTAANIRVLNASDGIHLFVNGQTQSGKSDSVKKSLLFIPLADRLTKTFSDMYLYHASKIGDLHEGMLVFSDDTVLSENVAALYRNMLTSWFTGVDRGTVVNHDPKNLHIPARISLILTAVESVVQETDEGQDESRFLTLEVRRTPEQMTKIRAFIQEPHPDIGPDLDIIYAAWSLIAPDVVTLHKSIDNEIPIREFKRYLTLVQAHAILCNRTTTTDADFLAIDQFLTYSKPMINSTTPGFLRNETVVMQCLADGKHKTAQEIQDSTGLTIQAVYKALRGKAGTFQNPKGGLMGNEPRLEYSRESMPGINDIHTFWLRK